MRLEPWLDDALNQRVHELKAEGYRMLTREAIMTAALMLYLDVTPPKDYMCSLRAVSTRPRSYG